MSETLETTLVRTTSTAGLKKEADAITTRRTLYAGGIGLLPFPLIDLAAILGVQIVMIKDIAKVYDVNFKEQTVRSIITTLVGDLGAVGVMSGVKTIPIIGQIMGGFATSLTGAAATYALGKVFTQHFDQGGTLLNFDPVKSRKYFQEAYEEGKLYVEDLSETDQEAKASAGWRNVFGRKKKEDVDNLKKENEEMKEMLIKLQQSVDALKSGK